MKKTKNFNFSSEKGIIDLPTIMIFALVIIVVGLSLLGGGFIENLISNISTNSQESFYLSDSGIQDGLIKITRNKNLGDETEYENNPNITESGEALSITVSGTTDKTVESSADIKNQNKKIKVIVNIDDDGKVTFSSWDEQAE